MEIRCTAHTPCASECSLNTLRNIIDVTEVGCEKQYRKGATLFDTISRDDTNMFILINQNALIIVIFEDTEK
eukprot:scaffold295735_cov18-Tisochrysis_lutea.AAC.1